MPSITSTNNLQTFLPALPQASASPAKTTAATDSSALVADSSKIGTHSNGSAALKDSVKLESKAVAYAKNGAIGGAVTGGIGLTALTYVIAKYTPANIPADLTLALGSLAIGALAGAAVGGLGGLTTGAIADHLKGAK